jgi:hypothetical protein
MCVLNFKFVTKTISKMQQPHLELQLSKKVHMLRERNIKMEMELKIRLCLMILTDLL